MTRTQTYKYDPEVSRIEDFLKCIDTRLGEDGTTYINCKLWLWSVESKNPIITLREAYHYWEQYADDGEYHSIIGDML